MNLLSLPAVVAAIMLLVPYLLAAFLPNRVAGRAKAWPRWMRTGAPALLCAPYILVTVYAGMFSWRWCVLYAALPAAIAALLEPSVSARIKSGADWPAFLILATLGLAVDLRWFESAWPPHLSIFNKMLLLNAGIYGFMAVRDLEGVGLDLRLRKSDWWSGLREFLMYLPVALALGLALGFLHPHPLNFEHGLVVARFAAAWVFTFLFIAVPEELFFRGWMQNLLERRIGRWPALGVTAILFGLSHFNKRAAFFNWRYVLLAAIAGFFYGRAWRRDRRVGASAVTHATVDAVWSLWLR